MFQTMKWKGDGGKKDEEPIKLLHFSFLRKGRLTNEFYIAYALPCDRASTIKTK